MIEKRHNIRRETSRNILVVARFADLRRTGRLLNMSVGGGCGLFFPEGFNVPIGTRFELVFAVPLNSSNVYRLHFKSAIVIHITDGTVGVISGTIERKLITAAA